MIYRIFSGVKYKIIRIRETKFFGFKKKWIEESQITITDKEMTVVDCLDKPQYCGGIIEVAKGLKNAKWRLIINLGESIMGELE